MTRTHAIAALLFCLPLAACGGVAEMMEVEDPFAVPKPFDESNLASWPVTARVHPITIFLPDGLAPADSERLQRAILERTKDSDVLAVLPGSPQPFSLKGRVRRTTTSAKFDIARVEWHVEDDKGKELAVFEVQERWQRDDEILRLPEDTAEVIADKTILALEPIVIPQQSVQTASAPPAQEGVAPIARELLVFVAPFTGAPGDGNQTLHSAISAILDADSHVQITPTKANASVVIEGRAKLTQPSPDQDQIQLVWRVTDAKGSELGEVAQTNAVPRGLLNGRWGDGALDAAQAAAGGIFDLFARLQQARAPAP